MMQRRRRGKVSVEKWGESVGVREKKREREGGEGRKDKQDSEAGKETEREREESGSDHVAGGGAGCHEGGHSVEALLLHHAGIA
eukprot:873216-Rhodomonas_salina.1